MTILTLNGNALHLPLPDKSAQCCITSPPYWGLRDYGVSGQLGLESTPEEYVANIVAAMREVWRVLRDDGVLWLNLGDSYAGSGNGWQKDKSTLPRPWLLEARPGGETGRPPGYISSKQDNGLKPKDLVGIPWLVALALRADGWYLRSEIIWHKPNPMPESVTDRPTKAHEQVFLLAKQEHYFYDAEAIRENADMNSGFSRQRINGNGKWSSKNNARIGAHPGGNESGDGEWIDNGYRNRRSVWTIATLPYSGAHFATFPPALVEPMVLAGSRRGDLVIDPFAGTSTVGRVCAKHGRSFVGTELNPAYIELAQERTSGVQIAMSAVCIP